MFKKSLGPLDSKQKIKFFIIIFALFISTFLELFSIGIVPMALIAILVPDKIPEFLTNVEFINNFFNSSVKDIMLFGSLFLLLTFVIKNFYLFILVIYEKFFLREINVNNASNLFKFFMNSNLLFHLERNPSKLYNILTHVNSQYVEYIRCLILFIKEILIVISIFFLLFYFQPQSSSIIFSLFFLVATFYYLFFRKFLFNRGDIMRKYTAKQNRTVFDSLGSIKETKILKIEKYFTDKFSFETEQREVQKMFLEIIQSIPRLMIEILIVCFIILIFYFYYINNYPLNSFLPILSFYAISSVRLMPAFNSIVFTSTSLKFLTSSLDVINKEVASINYDSKLNSNPPNQIKFENQIILNNVSFRYPNTKLSAVNNVSLKINCGEIVAFIGKSGVGKSTLIDLILGLHTPSQGQIFIDDKYLNDNVSSWLSLLGYVPQDIHISDDSIISNIAFGIKEEDVNIEYVQESIKSAQLDDFINNLPEGMYSKVGDKGKRISAGQKQRIGIARALYRNSKILILDEATSSLDHETEKDFIKTVSQISKNKKITVIFIAHKLNTLKICDKLFLIDDGKLIDEGNYNEIMSQNAYIRDYYKDEKK